MIFQMPPLCQTIELLTIDPSLGRFDPGSLPDQVLMELLVDGMNEDRKRMFQDNSGTFTDVSEWPGVQCDDDRVTSVDFDTYRYNEEPFPFAYVPRLAEKFSITLGNLHGTLDPSLLPVDLKEFSVFSNELHGSIDCDAFPKNMTHIVLGGNEFCGSLKLSSLPRSIAIFQADNNNFSGEVELNDLPPAMECLFLDDNDLTGKIHIERLPKAMKCLDLSRNCFHGDFVLMALPPTLHELSIGRNELSGKAVLLGASTEMQFTLGHRGVLTAVVDENGSPHAWEEKILSYTNVDDDSDRDEDWWS